MVLNRKNSLFAGSANERTLGLAAGSMEATSRRKNRQIRKSSTRLLRRYWFT